MVFICSARSGAVSPKAAFSGNFSAESSGFLSLLLYVFLFFIYIFFFRVEVCERVQEHKGRPPFRCPPGFCPAAGAAAAAGQGRPGSSRPGSSRPGSASPPGRLPPRPCERGGLKAAAEEFSGVSLQHKKIPLSPAGQRLAELLGKRTREGAALTPADASSKTPAFHQAVWRLPLRGLHPPPWKTPTGLLRLLLLCCRAPSPCRGPPPRPRWPSEPPRPLGDKEGAGAARFLGAQLYVFSSPFGAVAGL